MLAIALLVLAAVSASAAEVYGRIWLVDANTGRERGVDRLCRIEVRTSNQRLSTTSLRGARYFIEVPEEGPCELHLSYGGHDLSVGITSTVLPIRFDLFIHEVDDEWWLRAKWIDEGRQIPDKQ
jgi:hypothetical protein